MTWKHVPGHRALVVRRLGWLTRGAALVAVFTMALFAFRSGVDVSDRPGVPNAELLSQLYYAGGLFVLGGLDLGTPVGGPEGARTLLWLSYFLAPLITTSAVVEGALLLVGSRVFERFGLSQHVLVVGLGQLGTTFVTAFRSIEKASPIVALDRDPTAAAIDEVRREQRVRVLRGDARVATTFDSLALTNARGVALLTEDDLLNLRVAFSLAESYPKLEVVAHVANISLQRAAHEVEQSVAKGRLHVFNSHRVTAEQLYERHLRPYFLSTPGRDTVVLAGFGRFGQTILELLEQEANPHIAKVVLADRSAGPAWRSYRVQVSSALDGKASIVDGDLSDPETWTAIERELSGSEEAPAVVVSADDDTVNLQSALAARRCWNTCKVFVRFRHQSVFTSRLSEKYDFSVFGVDSLLAEALARAQTTWFPKR